MSSTGEVPGRQQPVLEQRSFEVSFNYFPVHFLNFKLRINARLGGCNSSSQSGVLAGLQSQPFMIVGTF
jgi:hypothetical protein